MEVRARHAVCFLGERKDFVAEEDVDRDVFSDPNQPWNTEELLFK